MISPYVFPGIIDIKRETKKQLFEKGMRYANIVIRSICFDRNITKSQILSKSRTREICEPRQMSMYFIKNNTELSLVDIGKIFNRDHSTVLFSIEQVQNRLSYDKKMQLEINRLKLLF